MVERKHVKVVFVDDSEINHFVLRSLTKSYPDFDFLSMEKNGQELLNSLENNALIPEIGIVDIHMPYLNGIATTRKLMKRYPDIKVYGFTSSSDDMERESMLEAGAFKIYAKDQLEALLEDIRKQKSLV
ncbi:response regulator [Sphingobacterium sp. UT-1RO-CII-1]|uniref:response regulator n=1 Tax=Sphingobacterium sp. UT-1RO-CII-1 TaxID=2995225 RepID=UPI00227D0877|nr:response regulator [Sphingobacterium sp. UT-1RO-CII-1]MCY4779602.1 response regulator [Sphingobacterium sp. UT-1RO-CII-1]